MPLLSSLSSALDALSTSATAFVLDSLPLLLHLYWTLAAGAVLFTLLPWDIAPGFKAAVRLSAARGKTMETAAPEAEKKASKASPSPSGKRSRSRSRTRSRAAGGSSSSGRGSKKASAAAPPSSLLGPFLSSLTVPQGWFLHFYALGSVAATAVLGAALRGGSSSSGGGGGGKSYHFSNASPSPLAPAPVAALALLLLHVLRRWAECAWQASWPAGARMHAVAYAFGMSYYAVLPLSLLPAGAFRAAAAAVQSGGAGGSGGGGGARGAGAGAAVAAFLSNKLGGISSVFAKAAAAPPLLQHPASLVLDAFASLPAPRLLGVAVFAAGSLLQAASHSALAALQRRAAAAKKQYLAPGAAGDSRLLSLCACPHYLGEIVIYAGLALVAAGGGGTSFSSTSSSDNLSAAGVLPLLTLVWVSVNLVLASAETKRWYRRRFPKEFPESRAALVPGVF